MLQQISKWLEETIKKLGYPIDLVAGRWGVEHPDELARGDLASNVALVLAQETKNNPLELAKQVAEKLKASSADGRTRPWLERVEVAAPGFINFFLTREFFVGELKQIIKQGDKYGRGVSEAGKKVLVEYTDPNPFKEFHIGHLMSNTIGEAISRLIASQGAEVKRACYQGDVGLHVAKAIWPALKNKPIGIADWAKSYALGSQADESDEAAKREINEINKKVYDHSDPEINALYQAGRKLSLDYFETIYQRLGTKFDFYFFESESGPIGQKLIEEHLDARLPRGSMASSVAVFEKSDGAVVFKKLVRDNLGKIFEPSEGAVIFRGEKYSLHTRVFLTKENLPTYEAKELGLAKLKFERYLYDESVVITGNEVASYFAVVKKALELIFPDLAKITKHLPHGMLRLPTGKMSSRTGTVVTAESLLAEIKAVVAQKIADRNFKTEEREVVAEAVAVAAIKYSILKQAPGRDIIFDLAKSLSFEGDSGPYLQYAYVRARAVIEKAHTENISPNLDQSLAEINELERRLTRFPEVVTRAAHLYAPNLLVTYLTELASSFNAYYATQKIVDSTDPLSPHRLALTTAFANIMKSGLTLLAVPVLERM